VEFQTVGCSYSSLDIHNQGSSFAWAPARVCGASGNVHRSASSTRHQFLTAFTAYLLVHGLSDPCFQLASGKIWFR
jgi:hypothetical protein